MKVLLAALAAVVAVVAGGAVVAVPLVEQHAARQIKEEIERDGLATVGSVSVGLFDRRIGLTDIRNRRVEGFSAASWTVSGLSWPLAEIVRGRLPLGGLKLGDPIRAERIEVRDFALFDGSGSGWKFGHLVIEGVDLQRYDPDVGSSLYGATILGARVLSALSVRKLEERDVSFTQTASGDGFSIASLTLENLDRGKAGALAVSDFRARDLSSQSVALSVTDAKITGFDAQRVLAAMSQESWMLGMPIGRLGLETASITGFGGGWLTRYGLSLESVSAEFGAGADKLLRGRARVNGLVLAPPLRNLETLQLRLAMTAMGLREARLDFDCSGVEDRVKGELTVDRCAVTARDLAEIDFTMKVIDADEMFWRVLDDGDLFNIYSSRAAIGGARLVMSDRSLIERTFRALGTTTGQPIADLRRQFAQEVRRFQPAGVLITEDLTRMLDTVGRFVEQGGTLTVEARPDPPFALERVGYLLTPGPDLVTMLGISARLSR